MGTVEDLERSGLLLGPISDDLKARIRDIDMHGVREGLQIHDWISFAIHYAYVVATTERPTPEVMSLFWIRLGGVLIDLRKEATFDAKTMREYLGHLADTSHDLRDFEAYRDSLDTAVAALDAEEAFFVEYRRNVECHPRQGAYRRRTGAQMDSKILRRKVSHEQSERLLTSMRAKFAGSDSATAKHIAPKLLTPLLAIWNSAALIHLSTR